MNKIDLIKQSKEEVANLTRDIDNLVDEYLASSELPKEQRIVNVGRALNAYFVGWVANLGAELETRNVSLVVSGLKQVPAFDEVKKEFNL